MPPKLDQPTAAALKRRADLKVAETLYDGRADHLLSTTKSGVGHVSSSLLESLQVAQREAEESYRAFLSLTLRIRELDTQDIYTEWNESTLKESEQKALALRNKSNNEFFILIASLEDALSQRAALLRPAAGANAGGDDGDNSMKIAEKLKPKNALSAGGTPIDYSTWSRQFRTYYVASNLANKDVQITRGALETCLDSTLIEYLRCDQSIDDDSPIYGENDDDPNCCLYVLRSYYERKFPWFIKLLDLLKIKQKNKESYLKFEARVKISAAELGQTPISVSDLSAAILITQNSNETQKVKLMETAYEIIAETKLHKEQGLGPKPANYLLDAICEKGKVTDAIEKNTESTERTSKITHSQNGNNGGSNHNKNKNKHNKNKPNKNSNGGGNGGGGRPSFEKVLKGEVCSCCGSTKHKRGDCSKLESAHCKKCNKSKSHVETMCFNSEFSKHFESARKKKNEKSNLVKVVEETEETCKAVSSPDSDGPDVELLIRQRTIEREILGTCDTGTTKSLCPLSLAEELKLNYATNRASKTHLYAANGSSMRVIGHASVELEFEGNSTSTEIIITPDVSDFLISKIDLKSLKIIPECFPHVYSNESAKQVVAQEMSEEELAKWDVWMKNEVEKLKVEFADVFDCEKLKPMLGDPMVLHFNENVEVTPMRVSTCSQVAVHLQKGYDRAVENMHRSGIIEPVPSDEPPSHWCFRGMVVMKPSGDPEDPRIVVDCSRLNPGLLRPVHTFLSPQDAARRTKGYLFYIGSDAKSGYFQVEVAKESRKYLTFLLPGGKGRWRFCRAPQGLSCSSDEYNRRSDEHLAGLEIVKLVDDILCGGKTPQIAVQNFRKLLERCLERNITLSPNKIQVGHQVKFAGYLFCYGTVRPHPDRLKSIEEFPQPCDKSGIRSFCGLANQLSMFHPDMAHVLRPLNELLRKNVEFAFYQEHVEAFERAKKMLTSPASLVEFDPKRRTRLVTDASQLHGLGYVILQDYQVKGETVWKLVEANSRSLLQAERNYSATDSELNAVVWAILKSKHYLQGCHNFEVVTDHKSLLPMFEKTLDELATDRQRRLIEKVRDYNFSVTWIAGKENLVSDALSRFPLFHGQDPPESERVLTCRINVLEEPAMPLAEITSAAVADPDYRDLHRLVASGVKPKNIPNNSVGIPFRGVWNDLSIQDDLVLYDTRVVVPRSKRREILQLLHVGHCGISKTREKAQKYFYWPRIDAEIANYVSSCEACVRLSPSQPRLPLLQRTAEMPWEKLGTDLFSLGGHDYLVVVDRYSGYLFCAKLHKTDTESVLVHFRRWCNTFGFPCEILSDNGPQFRSEFDAWCEKHSIVHVTSTPYEPTANGLSEAAVKSCKFLMDKCHMDWDVFESQLAEFNRTPRARETISPASLFFRRETRGILPTLPPKTDVDIEIRKGEERKIEKRELAKLYHDRNTRSQSYFQVDQPVTIQDPKSGEWTVKGTIEKPRNASGRSWVIHTEDKTYVRNRAKIRPRECDDSTSLDSDEWPTPKESLGMRANKRLLDTNRDEDTKLPRRSARIAQKHLQYASGGDNSSV